MTARPHAEIAIVIACAACGAATTEAGPTTGGTTTVTTTTTTTGAGGAGHGGASTGGSGAGGVGGAAAGGAGPDVTVIHESLHNTVLGRPTDRSIAISVLAAAAGDAAFIEYGTTLDAAKTGVVGGAKSAAVTSAAGEPMVFELAGLAKDTKYYYRVHYQAGGGADAPDNVHSFRTQRAPGRSFHFGVQGDSHPERYQNKMFHADLYKLTMAAVRDRQPDLYFMLGDDFSIEDVIQVFKETNYPAGHKFQQSVEGAAPYSEYQTLAHPFSEAMIVDGIEAPRHDAAYLEQRSLYLGAVANATSLFLVNGNHEQARSANLGGVFNNSAVWAADGRLKYYPLPAPDGFYSGDAEKLAPQNGYPTIAAADGLLRDYYAFTWGDALFVTIDPYWHSPHCPETTVYDGDPKKKDLYESTMGDAQYAWLKQTLESSTAKHKFVFAHHVNGTGRGGVTSIPGGEWGGGPDFAKKRPTWAKSVHQLLVDTKVTVFFQAHDHMFARETVDGVVYQEVPNPSDNSYFAYNCDAYAPPTLAWTGPAGYGKYDAAESVRLPNTGYLDVTVSDTGVHLEYIRTYRDVDLQTNPNKVFTGKEKNGEVAFAYSIPPQPSDGQAKDFVYTCLGDGKAPPADWAYNP